MADVYAMRQAVASHDEERRLAQEAAQTRHEVSELLGGEAKGGGAGDEIGEGDGDDEADAEVGLLGLQRATAHATEQERLAFAKADKTGSGFLDLNELFIALTTHGRRNLLEHTTAEAAAAAAAAAAVGGEDVAYQQVLMRGLNVDPEDAYNAVLIGAARSVATELCIERLSDTQLRAAARLFREYDTHRRGSLDFTGFASLLVAILRRGASSRSPPPRRGSADRSAAEASAS